ncbi:antibiotic biosynthesis monooxygenase family protein [Flexibacterium corallicola]|uniref:antibiotic biosynthesis monooxygenase family protein n=1 Tax=Flexibacterium corallicola TaxID=3037259 RepID=UPI00286EF095|nr:antibiotic biosynthesis monooxygenase [Pseudovibrio sp. M1P-2-3]
MYIAMNRFKVVRGSEKEFEAIWDNRERLLSQVPGYKKFQMLKGGEAEDHTLYASHTTWESEEAFIGWTKSDEFIRSHKVARTRAHIYLEGPHFEGFDIIMSEA